MARTSLSITMDLDGEFPADVVDPNTKSGRELMKKAARRLLSVCDGVVPAGMTTIDYSGAQPIAASGTAVLASVIATDVLALNGANLTCVASGASTDEFNVGASDTITATNLAAAINLSTNSAIITKNLEASNLAVTITLSSCTAGTGVSIAGYQFIARSVVPTNPRNLGDFSQAGTDTQDAASLVTAINTHPVLAHNVVASNSSGVVTVRQRRGTSSLGKVLVIAIPGVTPSGLSVGAADFAATATVLVSAKQRGTVGNMATISTPDSTITVSGARLTGGTGVDGSIARIVQGSVM